MATKLLGLLLALCAALVLARDARAQAGDLDILSRTVPPIVVLQFDTSGSMRQVILTDDYRAARGAGTPTNWFNRPSIAATEPNATDPLPATYRDTSYRSVTSGSGSEHFQPRCQIFSSSSRARNTSVCFANSTSCSDDENFTGQVGYYSGPLTPPPTPHIRCWDMPDDCARVPAGLGSSCTTITRSRLLSDGSTWETGHTETTIVLNDFSFTNMSLYPPNYLWYILNQIYLDNTPVDFTAQDRLAAAKTAIDQLVNSVNVTGLPAKVKFGLGRYDSGNNGGFIVVPPALDNKTTLLSTLWNLPADGSTPLSETLVDMARYLGGADRLGRYPRFDRDINGVSDPNNPLASPVTSSCEKLFVIAVTDGLPTSDSHDHHTSVVPTSATLAFNNTFWPAAPGVSYDDGDGQRLDDVAALLYATDLRPTLSGTQNVITYTVGFSLDSTILAEAADRGHGDYFTANDADDLADSLIGAINDIIARNTTLSSATVPSSRSAFGDGFYTAYFLPTGRKSVWPGHLEAYRFDENLIVRDQADDPAIDPVTLLFSEPRDPFWDAAATLLADFDSRTLYTTIGTTRTPFAPADINAAQLGVTLADEALYEQDPAQIDFTDEEDLADAVINWIHGIDAFDEDDDTETDDERPWVFGDVFHSNPVAIGPPLPFLRGETGYGISDGNDPNTFMIVHEERDRVLYVGSNGGMLHAFRAGEFDDANTPSDPSDDFYTAGNGHEIFGYVPGFLLNKVKLLPRDDIGKEYYVDGSPAAADVWIDHNMNGTKQAIDWTTVLLTPVREGGQGILALDVTDPTASTGYHGPYPRLMWEFTDSGLGQTWSKPIITRVKMEGAALSGDKCGRNDGDGDCVELWVAIFGAGYEPKGDPNLAVYNNDPNSAGFTARGRGIYVVRLDNGAVLAHVSQTDYSTMRFAITAEPAVLDLDFDGFTDVIYVGDLGGQLWKWDLSVKGSGTTVSTSIWPAGRVFTAPVATVAAGLSHYHSIFMGASAAFSGGVLTLSFGSGERQDLGYEGAADPNDPNSIVGLYDENNRFWVVKDTVPTGTGAFPSTPIVEHPGGSAPVGGTLSDVTNLERDTVLNDAGYYFRVRDGEKFVTNHIVFNGLVGTVSYMPDEAGAGLDGSCALGGTTFQWSWELDDGFAALDDPSSTANVRRLTLGNGAPTDPRITLSRDANGNPVVRITAQTSTGQVTNPLGEGLDFDPVDMVYWRQNF